MKVSVRKISVSEIGRSDRVSSEMVDFLSHSILVGDLKICDLSFGVRFCITRSFYTYAFRQVRSTHDVTKYDALTELLRQDINRLNPESPLKPRGEIYLRGQMEWRENFLANGTLE